NLTNDTTPSFGGSKVGDGTHIQVCDAAGAPACTTQRCRITVGSSATTFANCTSSAVTAGSRSFVAYEEDAAGNLSAPSATVTMTVNTTQPTLTTVPVNNTFNVANRMVGGACAT